MLRYATGRYERNSVIGNCRTLGVLVTLSPRHYTNITRTGVAPRRMFVMLA